MTSQRSFSCNQARTCAVSLEHASAVHVKGGKKQLGGASRLKDCRVLDGRSDNVRAELVDVHAAPPERVTAHV